MPSRRRVAEITLTAAAIVAIGCGGCGNKATPTSQPALASKYTPKPPRPVPEWLRGSIFEQVDLTATNPYRVSNFGLVVLKRPTGGTQDTPNNVREYLIREMVRRGFGSANQPGFENVTPEKVLADKRAAIVRVDAFIPPGATKGQRIDAQVTALEDTPVTSLAGGTLFTTDLSPNGADPRSPGNSVDVRAEARGYVFVNPAYAIDAKQADAAQKRALTTGVILNGGRVRADRPVGLLVRAAERRISRMIERRIQLLCGDVAAAKAMDEGTVFIYVPAKYRGDWEHFAGVVLHTYFNADASFATLRARQLVEEAQKPDAPLLDISYTWESLGTPALPLIQPLYAHAEHDVAFAAARAGAFIGDGGAEAALVAMAGQTGNQFRVNAVQTLAALPVTPAINVALRGLLRIEDSTVRIEAYRGLVRNGDTSIYSKAIGGDKFILDVIATDGPPLIYATRVGLPRIAFMGSSARLPVGAFFTAMDNELSISPIEGHDDRLTLFYRGAGVGGDGTVKLLTTPDVAEITARLGGEGPIGQPKVDLSYGEIVAILGKMSDGGLLTAVDPSQGRANFVLQQAPGSNRDVDSAPIIPEGPRPITTEAPRASR